MTARPGHDPAVVAWRIALAPQPRPSGGRRHWWREYVTEVYAAAQHAWWLQAEAASNGWATELAEFKAQHPPPRFRDFLVHLSTGQLAPERVSP